MKIQQILSFLFLTLWLPGSAANEPKGKSKLPPPAEFSVERLNSTPDLMQSLPAAKLPGNGLAFCGPVAVSNSMVWLSHHGYPRLALQGADTQMAQGRLAQALADQMGTVDGTTAHNFIVGISNFVFQQKYRLQSLLYQGWEDHPPISSTGVILPDPQWIKAGLNKPNSAVWLSVGFYNYRIASDEYFPFAQHWVTLVGYGLDKQGRKDANILIIHDPAPRSGASTSHDYVKLVKIARGKSSPYCQRPSMDASGWYKLTGDLKIKDGADCGILDGAVVLQLRPAQSP